jgi:hypothetical protein
VFIRVFGGRDRDRTGDPLLAKQVLSQLSYTPTVHPLRTFYSIYAAFSSNCMPDILGALGATTTFNSKP